MKKLLLLISIALGVMTSCEKEIPPITAEIIFAEGAVTAPTLPTAGGTATITFSSAKAWTAEVEAKKTWCTISPASGEAGAELVVTITATKNETFDNRTAKVTITSADVKEEITVTQTQTYSFSFEGVPKETLPAAGDIFVITTAENTGAPTVKIADDAKEWITFEKAPATKGLTNTTLTFTVKENTTHDNREAEVTITSGGKDEMFVVKQVQNDSFTFTGVPKEAFGINGGTFEITVFENMGVPTVKIADDAKEWITFEKAPAAKGLTETKFTFEVLENKTDSEHSTDIIITSGGKAEKFTVEQFNLNSPIAFPDAAFKAHLVGRIGADLNSLEELKIDTNGDGEISYNEASVVTDINCNNLAISSLTGIEHFTALTVLYCGLNQLTTLDVTKNTALKLFTCYDNQLPTLDVTKNTALTLLYCGGNQLPTLDVTKNTALKLLNCYDNQLPTLDVTKNTALEELFCSQNQLHTLDVSKNTALINLDCNSNQLPTLDVTNNTALELLYCNINQLSILDVTKNTELTMLYCNNNQLPTIGVTKNTALTMLYCNNNQLPTIDVTKNTALTILNCSNNQLSALDISKNTALTKFYCQVNQLPTLDVTNNPELELLYCNPMKDANGNNTLASITLTQAQKTAVDGGSFYITKPAETEIIQ